MPKESYTINQFESGINTNADPRDLLESELANAQDCIVDNLGKVMTIGKFRDHTADTTTALGTQGGKGLFAFSADHQGANQASNLTGTHDGSSGATILTDSGENWATNVLVGAELRNTTDSNSTINSSYSYGTVVANTDNDITTQVETRIASISNAGGGKVSMTTLSNHGLINGQTIVIDGTTNYNGSEAVEFINHPLSNAVFKPEFIQDGAAPEAGDATWTVVDDSSGTDGWADSGGNAVFQGDEKSAFINTLAYPLVDDAEYTLTFTTSANLTLEFWSSSNNTHADLRFDGNGAGWGTGDADSAGTVVTQPTNQLVSSATYASGGARTVTFTANSRSDGDQYLYIIGVPESTTGYLTSISLTCARYIKSDDVSGSVLGAYVETDDYIQKNGSTDVPAGSQVVSRYISGSNAYYIVSQDIGGSTGASGSVDLIKGRAFQITASYVAETPTINSVFRTHLVGGTENDWDGSDNWQLHNLPESVVGDDYLLYVDADTSNNFYVYSKRWDHESSALSLDGSQIVEPEVFQVDGNIRIADGNFGNDSNNKWYGYISRDRFSNGDYTGWKAQHTSNIKSRIKEWHLADQWIKRPPPYPVTEGDEISGGFDAGSPFSYVSNEGAFTNLNSSSTNATEGEVSDYVKEGMCGLHVDCKLHDEGLWEGYRKYYYSYIYDGIQETLLRPFGNASTGNIFDRVWGAATKKFRLFVNPTGLSKRITGARIYHQHVTSELVPEGEVYFLYEVDFDLGAKKLESENWGRWVDKLQSGSTYIGYHLDFIKFSEVPQLFTYSTLSRMSQDETANYCRYKTAATVNRKTYYGNVEIFHEKGPGRGEGGIKKEVKGDAIIKSPVNQFDNIPSKNMIEVSVNDGDSIVKLVSYADRLLEFKKRKLNIINVSQEIEFIEETFHHKGLLSAACLVETEQGIAWVNQHGAYFYDGKNVTNLLRMKGRLRISSSDWAAFVSEDSLLGYDPIKAQLILIKSSNASSSTGGDGYIYDFVTASWIKGINMLPDSTVKSNFVNDYDGKLVIHHGTQDVQYWDPDTSKTNSGSDWILRTRDIDFGVPGVNKKVYKVIVSYCSGANVPTCYYNKNGDPQNYGWISGTFATNQSIDDGWAQAEFTTTATTLNNIDSFGLTIKGTGSADYSAFQINDISVIFRTKRAK